MLRKNTLKKQQRFSVCESVLLTHLLFGGWRNNFASIIRALDLLIQVIKDTLFLNFRKLFNVQDVFNTRNYEPFSPELCMLNTKRVIVCFGTWYKINAT